MKDKSQNSYVIVKINRQLYSKYANSHDYANGSVYGTDDEFTHFYWADFDKIIFP